MPLRGRVCKVEIVVASVTHMAEKVSTKLRREMRLAFEEAIKNHPRLSKEPEYVIFGIANKLETACHNEAVIDCEINHIPCTYISKGFLNRYSILCDKYLRNLDVMSSLRSEEFGDMIASSQVNPENVVELTSRDINPLASQADHEEIRIRSEQKTQAKFTKRYQCRACGARRATYEEVQRSAIDEASHNRITCLECNNVWLKAGI